METEEQVALETGRKKGEKEKGKHLTLRYESKTKTRRNMKPEVGNCVRGF
jgi:hypothetical protein